MKQEPKISVVIPVYNSAKYLPMCLDTICLQTYENLEIICINDGSKDNSQKVLEKYAKKDSRIILLSQENSGQSVARNRGLRISTGDFLSFIDSDDFVSLSLYQKFVDDWNKSDNNIDIYMFNFVRYNEKLKFHNHRFNYALSPQLYHLKDTNICTPYDCKNPFMGNMSVANKIFSKNFLNKHNIEFLENMIFEDLLFYSETLFASKRIFINPDVLYRYRENPTSTMGSLKSNSIHMLEIFKRIDSTMKKHKQYNKHKYSFLTYMYNQIQYLVFATKFPMNVEFYNQAREYFKTYIRDFSIEKYNNLPEIDIAYDILNCSFGEFIKKRNKPVMNFGFNNL